MADPEQQELTHKPRRKRSPNYPGISLDQAIQRARSLYQNERTYSTPVNVALDHWGYSPKSGAGLVTLAALKHFGLIEDEGARDSRSIKLSDLALRIVQDSREVSPERDEATREAALTPDIHSELWAEYQGKLPSDANLRHKLIREKGFGETGAADFIKQFRATLAFAGLVGSDSMTQDEQTTLPPGGHKDMKTQVKPPQQHPEPERKTTGSPRYFNFPLSRKEMAVLQVPADVSEKDWEQFLTILEAMKPGIVTEDTQQDS